MKVSVIIPSLYEVDGEYLKTCVESLRATRPTWDIIVVTNGSTTKPVLKDIDGITMHVHLKTQGQCHAVNIGAQLVNPATKYIMVSNSDMYYPEGWEANLRFDDLVFSPNLVEPTNNQGSAEPFLKVDGGFTLDEFKPKDIKSFFKDTLSDFEGERKTKGFNLPFFCRLDVWQTLGGYDAKYDPWGSNSDTDLQVKFNLAGITPMRLRDVLVYHFSNKSGTFSDANREAWQKNWDYFQSKWGFNRDELNSDVWMNERILPEDEAVINYKPDWSNKYEGA